MATLTIHDAVAQYREVRRATLDKSDPTKGRAERIAALADIARAMPPSKVHPTRREPTGHSWLGGAPGNAALCDECSIPYDKSHGRPCRTEWRGMNEREAAA